MKSTESAPRTLAAFINARRTGKKLSMRDLAKIADCSQGTIQKLELGGDSPRGRVRLESLDAVLRALGIREGSDDYAHALAMWTSEQHGRADRARSLPPRRVAPGIAEQISAQDAERERLSKACEEALDSIPRELWPEMLTALRQHRALRLWLESANALTKQL